MILFSKIDSDYFHGFSFTMRKLMLRYMAVNCFQNHLRPGVDGVVMKEPLAASERATLPDN